MFFAAVFICALCAFHSTEAFCERLYKDPYWSPKSVAQRAVEADIVIYGNVSESPCVKPTFTYRPIFTAPPASNETSNSSSSIQPTTPSLNNTQGNITDVCLSRSLYNISVTVYCVIKGGSVPHVLRLRKLGFGPEMCTYMSFNYIETVQSFHMYRGQTYLIFLGRNKGPIHSEGFWPHNVNMQFGALEITDERFLEPVFQVAGGHAHNPAGMPANETRSVCTPYVSGAGTRYLNVLLVLLLFLCGLSLI